MNQSLGFSGLFAVVSVLVACGDSGDGGGGSGGSPPGDGGSGGDIAQGGNSDGGNGDGGDPQGGAPSGEFQAVHDTFCAPEDTIGRFWVYGFATATPILSGELWETTSPFTGPPTLTTDTCAFYEYTDTCPGNCDPGTICNYAGECVPERRSVKTASLLISAGGEEQTIGADPTIGGFNGEVTVGDAGSDFGMQLTWGDLTVDLAPLGYLAGPLEDAAILLEGDQSAPGALEARWTSSGAGGHVFTRININHHAAAGTFTSCAAPESAETFQADAEMIDPLAVITGLEFQGLEYVNVAAAETPVGCIEFWLGEQVYVFPE
jgi:hypothetical protein